MGFTSFSLFLIQCGGCGTPPTPGPGCLPCCSPVDTCGGPPPPPGLPIDTYIYFLFFAALVFGVYTISKINKAKLSS